MHASKASRIVYFKLLQRRARRKSAGRRRSGIHQRFPKETGKKCGSSRKDVGFKPGNRQGEIANQGKEVCIVPIAVADSLGDLDLVVEAFQLSRADRKHRMGSKAIQT